MNVDPLSAAKMPYRSITLVSGNIDLL